MAIDEPQGSYYGGTLAAPVFAEIASQSLSYLGIFPDEEVDGNSEIREPRHIVSPKVLEAALHPDSLKKEANLDFKDGVVPDLNGKTIRTVVRVTNKLGAEVTINGSGVAFRQSPAPGEKFAASEPINVWFK